DMQTQLQAAREALAAVQNQTAEATAQSETAGADLLALQKQVADLNARRDQLTMEVEGYQAQRDELQPQVEELAANVTARGEELLALEASISQATSAADAAVWTGRFVAKDGDTPTGLSLTLGEDDRFVMSNADGRSVEGSYTLSDTELVMSDAIGSVGNASFPMTCPISQMGTALLVGEAEGCVLAGLQFDRMP
ncbi:MAG: hypothetical protein KKE70_04790, partial [Alphaproteobacteria bacterium]|nr:hypothetical protein [Alphaproteobacteria bacterium]